MHIRSALAILLALPGALSTQARRLKNSRAQTNSPKEGKKGKGSPAPGHPTMNPSPGDPTMNPSSGHTTIPEVIEEQFVFQVTEGPLMRFGSRIPTGGGELPSESEGGPELDANGGVFVSSGSLLETDGNVVPVDGNVVQEREGEFAMVLHILESEVYDYGDFDFAVYMTLVQGDLSFCIDGDDCVDLRVFCRPTRNDSGFRVDFSEDDPIRRGRKLSFGDEIVFPKAFVTGGKGIYAGAIGEANIRMEPNNYLAINLATLRVDSVVPISASTDFSNIF